MAMFSIQDWFSFFGRLFVKYRDGFVTTAKSAVAAPVCGCDTSSLPYQDEWYCIMNTAPLSSASHIMIHTHERYNRIVADTGSVYQVPKNAAMSGAADRKRWTAIDKKDLRAFN